MYDYFKKKKKKRDTWQHSLTVHMGVFIRPQPVHANPHEMQLQNSHIVTSVLLLQSKL